MHRYRYMATRHIGRKSQKITYPISFDAPVQRTPANICTNLARNVGVWCTFLPLTLWVYLHSDFCGGLRKTHV